MKEVSELTPAPYNPRKMTEKRLEMLKRSMAEFGDLSGIIVNLTTGNLVGGHQRIKVFSPTWKIKKRPCKDDVGTVSHGYIETPWGRWTYREVKWDDTKEAAANIAANKHGGEWDLPKLSEMVVELDTGAFDMDVLGFQDFELERLLVDKNGAGDGDGGGGEGEGAGGEQLGEYVYQVVVNCTDEDQQVELMRELEGRGLECLKRRGS
jgi:hypothetical protein